MRFENYIMILKTQNSKLKTHNPKLKTMNSQLKKLKARVSELTTQNSQLKKAEAEHKKFRKLIIDTDRRLQEASQQLLDEKREAERELETLKHIKDAEPASDKKLTKDIAADLTLRYVNLLRCYLKAKDLDKQGPLVEEFCLKLVGYSITPRGIIDIHLKAVPQIDTIGDLETKRVTFESRMVLLTVMTKYASLLREAR